MTKETNGYEDKRPAGEPSVNYAPQSERAGAKEGGTKPPRHRRTWLLILAAAAQVLVLAGLLITNYAVGWYGKEIQLKTKPIDPRDIFYGDYVVLSYEISSLPASLWKGEGNPEQKDTVYVLLRPSAANPKEYEAAGVYPGNPATSGDEVALKAHVQYAWDRQITLRYGLERFYVPEGTGKEIEEQHALSSVRVTVAPWGQARVNGFAEKQ
ncbi:GDYXXLXY domain-containing protein [Paenibacillus sp. MBLB4367]|uniref:GDYXXLXY domain-containing protein n=1 Tax=Paenibacillus sp. MBLB4367 TaxID=3384767 RepID=UPI003907ED6E